MDREDSLGNITLPVAGLPSAAHKRRWLPLKRKQQQTSSDLCFDCWVTQFKKEKRSKFNLFSSSVSRYSMCSKDHLLLIDPVLKLN